MPTKSHGRGARTVGPWLGWSEAQNSSASDLYRKGSRSAKVVLLTLTSTLMLTITLQAAPLANPLPARAAPPRVRDKCLELSLSLSLPEVSESSGVASQPQAWQPLPAQVLMGQRTATPLGNLTWTSMK